MQPTANSSAARGYVHGPFHIFHLTDIPDHEIPIHFHDFRKIVILIKGNLFYDIEGERYTLEDGDIVLVEAGEHHHPVLLPGTTLDYDRIIIYLSDSYFADHAEADLDRSFRLLPGPVPEVTGNRSPLPEAAGDLGSVSSGQPRLSASLPSRSSASMHSHVIRGRSLPPIFTEQLIPGLTEHFSEDPAVQQLMMTCRLTEFLLQLNRAQIETAPEFSEPVTGNPIVRDLMQYLSEHLTEPLDIEKAAGYVHLDRSYLMHRFKAETGFSIMTYITEKRLFLAQSLLRQGIPAAEAAGRSGFTNYTSFYRSYRKRYGSSPREGGTVSVRVLRE